MIFLNEQLQLIYFIQQARGSISDIFFIFLNFFDSDFFEIGLVTFVWLGFSAKWGKRLGFLLCVNGLINYIAKQIFGLPRPFHFDSSLALVNASQYGFPSGGAQLSFLLGCLLLYYGKGSFIKLFAVFYILLISFSRLFLGVHFPIDIIGGWTLASIVFYVFARSCDAIEKFIQEHPQASLFMTLIISLVLTLFIPYFRVIYFTGFASVFATGIYLNARFGQGPMYPSQLWKRCAMGLFGIFVLVMFAYLNRFIELTDLQAALIQVTFIGFWISIAASNLYRTCFNF